MSNTYNKDFYAFLPKYMTTSLEQIVKDYGNEKWFPDAWEEYRKLVYGLSKRRIPTPNLFFGKKINESINVVTPEISPEFQEHYEKYFKPTVQEKIKKEYYDEKNKNHNRKNKKRHY